MNTTTRQQKLLTENCLNVEQVEFTILDSGMTTLSKFRQPTMNMHK